MLKKKIINFLWELANKTKILFLLFLLIPTLDVNAAAPPTIEINTLKKEVEKPRTTFTEQESLVLQKIAIAEAQSEGETNTVSQLRDLYKEQLKERKRVRSLLN